MLVLWIVCAIVLMRCDEGGLASRHQSLKTEDKP